MGKNKNQSSAPAIRTSQKSAEMLPETLKEAREPAEAGADVIARKSVPSSGLLGFSCRDYNEAGELVNR